MSVLWTKTPAHVSQWNQMNWQLFSHDIWKKNANGVTCACCGCTNWDCDLGSLASIWYTCTSVWSKCSEVNCHLAVSPFSLLETFFSCHLSMVGQCWSRLDKAILAKLGCMAAVDIRWETVTYNELINKCQRKDRQYANVLDEVQHGCPPDNALTVLKDRLIQCNVVQGL